MSLGLLLWMAGGKVALGLPAEGEAAGCPAAAVVEGRPGHLVAEVRELLAAASVQANAPPRCAAVQASIAPGADSRPMLRVTDPHGRTSVRRIASARAAAVLIESWARGDFTAALLRGPRRPPAVEPAAVTPPAAVAAAVAPPMPPPMSPLVPRAAPAVMAGHRPPTLSRLAAEGAAEVALGSDRSAWPGAAAGLCLVLERVCLGPTVRLARSGGWQSVDGLVAARLLSRSGPALLSPTVALGYGWRGRDAVFEDPGPAELGPQQGAVGPTGPLSSFGLRVEAQLALAVPLTSWMAVDLRAGVGGPLAQAADGGPPVLLRAGVGLRLGRP